MTQFAPSSPPSRIHITGSAGSGKSTLAQRLSTHLNAPWYDLDLVAYEGGFGRKIPLDERIAALQPVIAQPAWITEGVFLWWTTPLMDAADLIVWLDMPFYVNGWRIITRHFRLNRAGTNRHPGTLKMLRFLQHVMRKQIRNRAITPKAPDDDAATTRIATGEFLLPYAHKVVHCKHPRAPRQPPCWRGGWRRLGRWRARCECHNRSQLQCASHFCELHLVPRWQLPA